MPVLPERPRYPEEGVSGLLEAKVTAADRPGPAMVIGLDDGLAVYPTTAPPAGARPVVWRNVIVDVEDAFVLPLSVIDHGVPEVPRNGLRETQDRRAPVRSASRLTPRLKLNN